MSQSDVPIQNSQYVALFDDFCILVAPESDFPGAGTSKPRGAARATDDLIH